MSAISLPTRPAIQALMQTARGLVDQPYIQHLQEVNQATTYRQRQQFQGWLNREITDLTNSLDDLEELLEGDEEAEDFVSKAVSQASELLKVKMGAFESEIDEFFEEPRAILGNLRAWQNEEGISPLEKIDREIASRRICRFISQNEHVLNLSRLRLSTLPECLKSSVIHEAVQTLDLSGSCLSQLPPAIYRMYGLRVLRLCNCQQLEGISDDISSLSSLQAIYFSQNHADDPFYEEASFSWPKTLAEVPKLETLCIDNTYFEVIPPEILACVQLKKLCLVSCQISFFPENLGRFTRLEDLDLSDNAIAFLPDTCAFPASLELLNLSDNLLVEIPTLLKSLSPKLLVIADDMNLERDTIEALHEMIQDPHYEGPGFILNEESKLMKLYERSMAFAFILKIEEIAESLSQRGALKELFVELFEVTEIVDESDLEEANVPSYFHSWFNRIVAIGARERIENKRALFRFVLKILEKAAQDPAFKELFIHIVKESSTTCGDRILYYLLQMDAEIKLMELDLDDKEAVADFLIKGPMTLDLLFQAARDKETLLKMQHPDREIDAIEIYLAYPIKLQAELGLPISITHMEFPHVCHVNAEDLKSTLEFIEASRSHPEGCAEFLMKQSVWDKCLDHHYESKINKKMRRVGEDESEEEALARIKKKLTLKILENVIVKDDKPISKKPRKI
jgi:Leucine-rich repeat (LRR) protein